MESWKEFYALHKEEIDRLRKEYKELGLIVPGNTFEEVVSLEVWLEMLRNHEEEIDYGSNYY